MLPRNRSNGFAPTSNPNSNLAPFSISGFQRRFAALKPAYLAPFSVTRRATENGARSELILHDSQSETRMKNTIALIAHDSQKETIANFTKSYIPTLSRYRLLATANTGNRIQVVTGLPVERMLPIEKGGYVQIAAEVAVGHVVAVFLFIDPAQVQSLDVQILMQLCVANNVAFAVNLSSAEAIATHLAKTRVGHLIFNPVSGQGNPQQDLDRIQTWLEPHMHLHIHETDAETAPADIAKQILQNPVNLVIAAGGDGTVSAVAGALIQTDIPLGIIPRGTANAFAAALGIPMGQQDACNVILQGQVRTIDAAYCNGTPMTLLAGIGYEANVVEKTSREFKNQWGAMAYLISGWQQMDEQELFETELEAGGEVYRFQAGAVTVANAAPPTSVLAQGGGEVIASDGLLDVTVATVDSKLSGVVTMLRALGSALMKTGFQDQNVVHSRASRLKVTTNPPQKVVVDGEVIGVTPVEVECVPESLQVIVPRSTIPPRKESR
jgi:diacylglycerol kinase (ATP)